MKNTMSPLFEGGQQQMISTVQEIKQERDYKMISNRFESINEIQKREKNDHEINCISRF